MEAEPFAPTYALAELSKSLIDSCHVCHALDLLPSDSVNNSHYLLD